MEPTPPVKRGFSLFRRDFLTGAVAGFTGSIAAGAIIGLMAGLIATTIVARVLTSCAGAWLLLVGSLPLLAMHGHEPLPHDARSWLITIASLALAGTIAQSYLGASTGTKRAPRRAKPDPEPQAEPALAK